MILPLATVNLDGQFWIARIANAIAKKPDVLENPTRWGMASDDRDTTGNLLEMARQASCIAAYLHRGDIELAAWLLRELQQQLCEFEAFIRNGGV